MNFVRNERAQSGLTILIALIAIVVVILGLRAFEQIDAGKEGVVYNLDSGVTIDKPLPPGFNWLNPFTETVVSEMSTQIQKLEVDANAATKDMQPIGTHVALNYRIAQGKVPWIYQNIGIGYEDTVISPALQDTVKTVTARYPVSQIIDMRDTVGLQAEELMRSRMKEYNIVVTRLNLVNIGLDPEYQKTIIEKQTADQRVLTAMNNLRRIEIEKNQTIAEAQGRAEAMRIQGEALSKNQNLVAWNAVNKWDGKMPIYLISGDSNTGMLFNIPTPTQ